MSEYPTSEVFKNTVFYDKKGTEIMVGDLLKVYHFGRGRGTNYMYHVVMLEMGLEYPVMAARDYYADKPHYRLYASADKETRILRESQIIHMQDWQTRRKRIKP